MDQPRPVKWLAMVRSSRQMPFRRVEDDALHIIHWGDPEWTHRHDGNVN